MTLDFTLDEQQLALRDGARQFADGVLSGVAAVIAPVPGPEERFYAIKVLAAATGGSDRLHETGREKLDETLRASISRYLDCHVRQPDVSATHVARRFGISVRKLHRLYEG